ncbi:MAG: DinB family protein [Anaerolineales bacterium]|nr:DinB family protein [Anaerolineales bacterium]
MPDNNELYEYRANLLARTLAAAGEFCLLCPQSANPFAPVSEAGWNIHQIAAHVRDVDRQVYGMRLRQAVTQERPTFQNFDGEAWLSAHYDSTEPLEKILEEFQSSIHTLVGWLASLPPAAWSRSTRHEVYGEFAMQAWVERGLAHIEEHICAVSGIAKK